MLLTKAATLVNRLLVPFDVALVRRHNLVGQLREYDERYQRAWFQKVTLPAGAAEYLHRRNPRLLELKQRYQGHPAAVHSVWTESYLNMEAELSYFRGDNAYIWQTRRVKTDPQFAYAMSAYYVEAVDRLGLTQRLEEDGQFGAITFPMDQGRLVSRDLLDSIWEINFLERHLRISEAPALTVVDVGAGYGRLAHRLAQALPNLEAVLCTDAVPLSTFLCDYYLKCRGVSEKAQAVPLDEIERTLATQRVDLATNIHSFPECPFAAISWWLDLLRRCQVKYLMLGVELDPTGEGILLSREPNGRRLDFRTVLTQTGFEQVTMERVYAPGSLAESYGLYPDRAYYLFRNTTVG